MTTTIIVKTHSWPVEVKTKDEGPVDSQGRSSYSVSVETIAPNSEREIYIHSSRSLKLTELPQPQAQQPE